MALVTFDFEGQTAGTAMTTTSSSPTLTSVVTGCTYGSIGVYSGATSMKATVQTTNTPTFVRVPLTSNMTYSFGGAFTYDAPSGVQTFLGGFRNSTGYALRLYKATTDVIRVTTQGNVVPTTLLASPTIGARYYVSYVFTVATATTGSFTIKIYDSSNTLLNTITSTTYDMGSTPIVAFDAGVVDSGSPAGRTTTWDYLRFNDGSTTEIGPVTSFNDNATMSGAGTLSAGNAPQVPTTAGMSGAGSLGAVASAPSASATASMGGTGALGAIATVPSANAIANFSGVGSLGTNATTSYSTNATMLGTGGLSYSSTLSLSAIASLAGTGVLSAVIKPSFATTVAFSGSGTLGASSIPKQSATVPFSGAGTLAATVVPQISTIASMSAVGNLSPGNTLVSLWIASQPYYVAHFGGDVSWPPGLSAFAYNNASNWNTSMALEVSMWQTTDGIWVVSHDNTTDTLYGTTGNVLSSSTWASISSLTTVVGGYPIMRADALFAAHPNRVWFVEDKGSQDQANWLNTFLPTYGGPSNFIIKSGAGSISMPNAAHAAGYKTWGYFSDVDFPLGTKTNQFDLLGMDYTSSSTNWATIVAVGKPVLGHIIPNAAAKATAQGYGAVGYMASGVQTVVPQTPVAANFSGAGTLGTSSKPGAIANAAMSGVGTLGVTQIPKIVTNAPLIGTGTLSATGSTTPVANAGMSGIGNLAVTVVPRVVTVAALNASGQLAVSIKPNFASAAAFSGTGYLTATGTVPSPYVFDIRASSWSGTKPTGLEQSKIETTKWIGAGIG